MHELIVHALQYRPMIEQFRQTENRQAELPLLYHAHLEEGTISATEHHKKHGSKAKGEAITTEAGEFQPSGFKLFNEQVKHTADALRKGGQGDYAKALLDAVTDDVRMQGKEEGNIEATYVFADHSLGLMIGYLVDKRSLSGGQKTSCDQTAKSLNDAWLAALDNYTSYKANLGEAPFNSILDKPSKKFGRLRPPAATVSFREWLVFQPENILETLLEHLALSGEALTTDFSEDDESPVAPFKQKLVPRLKSDKNAQNYAAFRAALEKARGKDPAAWMKLLEALIAYR
jgi:hypothetical protein